RGTYADESTKNRFQPVLCDQRRCCFCNLARTSKIMTPRRTLLSSILLPPGRKVGNASHISWVKRLGHWIAMLVIAVVVALSAAWAFGAAWFDGPFGAGNKLAAVLLLTVFVALLMFVRGFWRKIASFLSVLAGVLIWWL